MLAISRFKIMIIEARRFVWPLHRPNRFHGNRPRPLRSLSFCVRGGPSVLTCPRNSTIAVPVIMSKMICIPSS